MAPQKQRFNSAASEALAHLKERAKALEPLGWTGRRAQWIALAGFHGGVFTRAQWTSFLGCHHEKVGRAVRKLVGQGVAIEEKPPGINGIGRPPRASIRSGTTGRRRGCSSDCSGATETPRLCRNGIGIASSGSGGRAGSDRAEDPSRTGWSNTT